MWSVPSRLSDCSHALIVPAYDALDGNTLVTTKSDSRGYPLIAWATIRSAPPSPYISAVSMWVRPRSRPRRSAATSSRSARRLSPMCQVPCPTTGTSTPVAPKRRLITGAAASSRAPSRRGRDARGDGSARVAHAGDQEPERDTGGGHRHREHRGESEAVGQEPRGERRAEGDGRQQGGAETDVGRLLAGCRGEFEHHVQVRDVHGRDLDSHQDEDHVERAEGRGGEGDQVAGEGRAEAGDDHEKVAVPGREPAQRKVAGDLPQEQQGPEHTDLRDGSLPPPQRMDGVEPVADRPDHRERARGEEPGQVRVPAEQRRDPRQILP